MVELSCECTGLGHRYRNNFLFRNLHFTAQTGQLMLFSGPNGSGKSTLLKLLSLGQEAWEGKLVFKKNGKELEPDQIWNQIGFVAPYQDLPEDFSLLELVQFQCALDGLNFSADGHLYKHYQQVFGLNKEGDKPLRNFSTGMKQKARFVLGLGSNRPIWILDEPTSNLDEPAFNAFWNLIDAERSQKLIFLASNDPRELERADLTVYLNT